MVDRLIRVRRVDPLAVEPWAWLCRGCAGPGSFGFHGTHGEAVAGGVAHLRVCPEVLGALDRLLADVMALPEYRRMWLPGPTGGVREVVVCVDCGSVVMDEDEHTVTHVEAIEVRRG